MNKLKWLVIFLVLLAIMVLGIVFFAYNSEPMTLDYGLAKTTLPLSVVLSGAFVLGMAIAALLGTMILLPMRWQLARQKRQLEIQGKETTELMKQVELHKANRLLQGGD